MPRPYEYSRGRYVAMQIAMWVILLASVGVAALVSRARSGPRAVALGEPVDLMTLTVRLPKGWRIQKSDEGEVSLIAIERARAPFGRTIEVTVDKPGFFQSFLSGDDTGSLGETISFGDIRGGMVVAIARPRKPGTDAPDFEEEVVRAYVVAHGISDDGRRIQIRLTTTTNTDDVQVEDEQLVQQIAASVKKLDAGPQIRAR